MSSSEPGNSSQVLHFVVADESHGQRLDSGLSEFAGVPRSQIQRWIEAGLVRVDGEVAMRGSRKLAGGEVIEACPPVPESPSAQPEELPLSVTYEDDDLIVVDKAAGMVVHPGPGHSGGTLVNALLHHCGDLAGIGGVLRPGIVHRLDRGTSGIIVAAKNDRAHNALAKQFHDHSIERIYLCFVRGIPKASEGRIELALGRHARDRKRMSVHARSSRNALTQWYLAERYANSGMSFLEVHPETGRTHQIRVHLSAVGLPIWGDPVYGKGRGEAGAEARAFGRPALHAALLGFVHPSSGETLRFSSPLPADMAQLQEQLREEETEVSE
jgi:23S rRNA pseudouridine1911/1915/1917 synthase